MFNTGKPTGGQNAALAAGCKFAIDNGAFSGQFTEERWLSGLARFAPYVDNCLFAIVPDVVFNWEATRERFDKYYRQVARMGFPVAYATQNGQPSAEVPWESIGALFIDGDHNHKRNGEAQLLAQEARRRGKWVHVGRVSSGWRIIKNFLWCDSCDGTTFKYSPSDQTKYTSIINGLNHDKIWQSRLI